MLWDLRNARAPEKILTGHDKGVLSLSWCKQDPDLLLSCGKDNRTICWNPQTSEIVGELPPSQNWSFDVQWSPKNPDMIATASFDGKIGIHSLQATNVDDKATDTSTIITDANDIFNSLPSQVEASNQGISLKQPPKWLRRPISATFGFGGQLVSTSNLSGDKGQHQSSVVHLRSVVTEPAIVERAKKLQEALESQSLADFCDERSRDATTRSDDVANWKALQTLFRADSRDELVALLGFSKEDVEAKVASAIKAFKRSSAAAAPGLSAPATPTAEKPAMLESVTPNLVDSSKEVNGIPDLDVSADGIQEVAAEVESKEPNLFGDSDGQGADVDVFSTLGEIKSALPSHLADGNTAPSAAATIGSGGPPSVISEGAKANTFRIYPADEPDADKLITRAIVLGDFESAVSLCVSMDRFADALLLAVRGGTDLLARTQKAYFERRTTSLPYLRLFQSIVSDDLTDIVQNADLNEWQEVFVVICTFATKNEDFVNLAEQLGQRLEHQYSNGAADKTVAKTHRKNAVLCYLAAGKLEKVAGMWIDEMKEEEMAIRSGQSNGIAGADATTIYSAHAEALQTFMEKITVFQSAVQYVDVDLAQPTQDAEAAAIGARSYKLSALYDCIHEYVEVLADQGLITPALQYVSQTPADYRVRQDEASSLARERLVQADQARSGGRGLAAVSKTMAAKPLQQANVNAVPAAASSAYAPSVASIPQSQQPAYDPYDATSSYQQQSYANTGYDAYNTAYAPPPVVQASLPPMQQQQPMQQQGIVPPSVYAPTQPMVPAPPPPIMHQNGTSQHQNVVAPPPPPPKRDQGGWNDIPQSMSSLPKRSGSAMSTKTSAPITSPFPMSPAMGNAAGGPPPNMYGSGNVGPGVPPPPRGGTPGARPGMTSPPPPMQNQYGRGPSMPAAPPSRPPPMGPARGNTPGGNRQPPPMQQTGPPSHQQQQLPPQAPMQTGPYAPAPGQVSMPPSAGANQHPPQQYGGAPPTSSGFNRPPMPPMPSQQQVPQQQQQQQNRSVTPGLGAGPPPQASARPASAKPATKYPAGDRSHIPDNAKPIVGILSRELMRFKSSAPPPPKKTADDVERRLNLLFDLINCGTVEPKAMPLLHQLCQAIESRNQQAALGAHVQLVSTSSGGDLSAALVAVKLLISKMGQ